MLSHFVANRVQKSRQSTSPQQWFYVPTEENPVDSASQGKSVKELLTSNWFTGPIFLWEKEIPGTNDVVPDLTIGDLEINKAQTLLCTEPTSLADHLSKFSSRLQATKAVAHLLRWTKKIKSHAPSTVSELESAECVIIQALQSQAYEKEIKFLNKGSQLPHCNKLQHVDVFLDTDGILKAEEDSTTHLLLNHSSIPSSSLKNIIQQS